MKKLRIVVMLSLLISLLSGAMIVSFAEEIRSIEIDVILNEDGSADITQRWDVTTNKGTEFYITMSNMGDMEVQNFRVSDETGREFTFVENWDIDASLQEKAYKNGFNEISGGFEMCWGKGSYGSHRYTLRYTLTNLVKSYPDYDGFLTRFVNDQMSPSVEYAVVRITRAGVSPNESFVAEETGVWGFGYEGTIWVEDGVIVAETDSVIDSSDHMTVMVRLPKGLLEPISIGSGTFAELEERAKSGSDYGSSDYDEGSSWSYDGYEEGFSLMKIIFFIVPIIQGFVMIIIVSSVMRRLTEGRRFYLNDQYRKMGGDEKRVDYYRDLPIEGSVAASYYATENVFKQNKKELISATVLQLIKEKALIPETRETTTFWGTEKEEITFVIEPSFVTEDALLRKMYGFIVSASGEDMVLQEKELKKWARKNYTKLEKWFDDFWSAGEREFKNRGGINIEITKGLFKRRKETLTEKGFAMISQVLGFKRFLTDFTLIAERGTKEIELWDEYLIFAALFGMADKVAEEMKSMYPDFAERSAFYNDRYDMMTTIRFSYMMNNAIYSGYSAGASAASMRSSGGGGFSSGGGGGGFSGGGSGGGSR